jgi:GTP pyrophosphokinase
MTFDDLAKKTKGLNLEVNLELIKKAYLFAQAAHQSQFRRSGEPYIQHSLATADTLIEMKLDSSTIAAGLLHDVVDDTGVPLEQIKKEFGKEIAKLVEGVTKLGKIKYRGAERQIENLRKMFLAMAEDIRVVLIKLSDRLHNMKTLSVLPPEKQQRIALETKEIYAPLADRLGIGRLKGELEDSAFQYLMPGEYSWLLNQVRDQYAEREKYLTKIIPDLKKELAKENIRPLEIHWRAKHAWSLYQKLQRYEMNLSRIYDLVALRIIVPTVEDCYATLGVIHKLWRPLPGRIKDYIALPKPNGYQSIHTTVFCQGGKITEIQIRTLKMHEEAERGIAAHWYYSEQKGLRAYLKKILTPAPERELKWIQQLQQWQKEIKSSPDEFFQSLKIDFFKDRIFVFTPKGDVMDLPESATPIDFAYLIHTDIGHRCQGAKVDGKMVTLDMSLRNGQVIEIITQKQAKPSRDWLKFAKTHQAQNRIRQWLNKSKVDFAAIEEIKKEPQKLEVQKPAAAKATILKPVIEVEGDAKIATMLAKCCHPQPPDPIVGYITLDHRLTVHRRDCRNLAKIKDASRLINVNWKKQ